MGKTYGKVKVADDSEGHSKNASRHGHTAKYKKAAKEASKQRPLPESLVRRLTPSDILHNEEFVNGLDYDD